MIQFLDGRVTLYPGNCLEVLASMPENSIDSAIMDPPYHLTSIVKRFGGDMPPRSEAAVGKHAYGRHASGFMGKEWDGGDIAFQIATWEAVKRVLKPGGYLLAFASTRGFWRMAVAIEDAGFITHPMIAWVFGSGFPKATRLKAEGYDGWRYGGQALKPAIEPIYMGQKPFSEKTGTANVLLHGTGAVNIDGCRVSTHESTVRLRTIGDFGLVNDDGWRPTPGINGSDMGRWPANLIHDGSDEVLEAFPDAPGQQGDLNDTGRDSPTKTCFGDMAQPKPHAARGDSGSASRFFYSAKADADDRIGSKHPTVKPVNLMRYLVRLVTPPGGTVLDCFAGTGTTGEAAWREGFNAILIEREPEYQQDIAERMRLCLSGPDEKRREIIKRRGLVDDDAGPLFGGAA
ncbi:site-specific DNA-methyltransferase [Agrobacterium tumefaciens]|uniref:DNA-methyltransferase n=1 Tax=Agrobacterium tumefaciens TaxID=358 RepID=UPI001574CFCA|nr:site-specific DNA-methyltransferase [Agrobacterium tumefaciens]NTA79944.1 site-specific DNA-methyltransferase [Agrobacterium tumefaciens]